MSTPDLDLTEVDTWLEGLAALDGIESATRDPGRLNLPGVLVRILDIRIDTLDQSAWKLDLDVLLVTADDDVYAAQGSLADLLNRARPFFGNPPGSFTPRSFPMPDGSTRPALAFAHTITIEQETP